MNYTILKQNKTKLTLLTVCLVFLAGLLLVTVFRTSFHGVDVAVNLWIPSIQLDALTYLAKGVAIIFDTTSLVLLSLLISGIFFLKNYKAQGLLLLAAMGGIALIISAIKTIEQVARPMNGILDTTNFSYPSGHSAGVVVFAGVLAYFAWRHWQSMRSRALTIAGLGVVVGGVGFDRLYLNVHWLSDVLGGWLLGAFWLLFAVAVFRQFQVTGRLESKMFSSVAMLLYGGAVMVAVFIVLYGLFGVSFGF